MQLNDPCLCHYCSKLLLLRPQQGCEVLWCVCLFVFLFVCPLAWLENCTTELFHTFCACSLCLWWHYDTLCTSGFMDDVMLSYYGASGPESSKMLCLEEVHRVAVPAWHQTTMVFGWVRQNATPGTKSVIYDCLAVTFRRVSGRWNRGLMTCGSWPNLPLLLLSATSLILLKADKSSKQVAFNAAAFFQQIVLNTNLT